MELNMSLISDFHAIDAGTTIPMNLITRALHACTANA